MLHATGTILKYNTMWRAGMHYNYIFFKVSHKTKKGNTMGRVVACKRSVIEYNHDYHTDKWQIDVSRTISKIRRLPHPDLWEVVSEEELMNGIQQTSCTY